MSKDFGTKMIEKMGFKSKGYIGQNILSYQQEIKNITPRTQGQGLGADNEEVLKQAELKFPKIGSKIPLMTEVYLKGGEFDGFKGKVVGFEDKLVKIDINGETIKVKNKRISVNPRQRKIKKHSNFIMNLHV